METQRDVLPRSLFAFQRGEEPYPPTTPEEPPMAKFAVNDTVKTMGQVKVRSSPGIILNPDNLIGLQPDVATGFILAGPVAATGYIYYKVDFNTGVDGWVGEDRLEKAVSAPPLTARQRAEAKLVALGLTSEEAATL